MSAAHRESTQPGNGTVDAGITYLFRITARTEHYARMRALLLHSIGGQPLLLKSLKSDDVEHTDKVEVHAILTSTGRQYALLEQMVSRLSLEPRRQRSQLGDRG